MFHVSKGKPTPNATKIWLTKTKGDPSENDTKIWVLSNGSFKLANNKGKISKSDLSRIFSIMQSYYYDYLAFWKNYFSDEIKFYE